MNDDLIRVLFDDLSEIPESEFLYGGNAYGFNSIHDGHILDILGLHRIAAWVYFNDKQPYNDEEYPIILHPFQMVCLKESWGNMKSYQMGMSPYRNMVEIMEKRFRFYISALCPNVRDETINWRHERIGAVLCKDAFTIDLKKRKNSNVLFLATWAANPL